jgi:YgiT-type zinc finger domain-containing protein
MTCVICKQGQTFNGTATVTLERDNATIIIKDVPAEVCENCGEYYLSEETTGRLEQMAKQAIAQGVVVEVLRYAA